MSMYTDILWILLAIILLSAWIILSIIKFLLTSDIILKWLGVIISMVIAIVAIFRNEIDSWRVHPDLDILIISKPPDFEKIDSNTYWLRSRIKNLGNKAAEKVEVFAEELLKLNEKSGLFERVDKFLPMRMLWSNVKTPTFDIISPDTYKHCELGCIIKDKNLLDDKDLRDSRSISAQRTVLHLNIEAEPKTKCNILVPGKYHLKLLIASANSRHTIKRILEIDFKEWSDIEEEMISDKFSVKIL